MREKIILVMEYWEDMTSRENSGFLTKAKTDSDQSVW